MAEYVHQTLEEMLPELEEMTRSQMFTPQETKIILKKREALEYRLRQKTKTKKAYVNYIEYEEKLLELINLRIKQNGLEQGKREVQSSIMERINNLHRLLTTRFPEDISLWERNIQFCIRTNQLPYVTRLYNKILRIHSHREDIWVKAAQFERSPEGNGNPELARELLLKAQRVLPNSEIIYLEMYQMELDLATTVLKRKRILNMADEQEMETEDEKHSEFKLAQIVAKKALELFPGNPHFHLKMLNVCSKCPFASHQKVEMISQLKEIYSNNPDVWNAIAMCELNKYKKLAEVERKAAVERCMKTLRKGLTEAPCETMWSHCLWGHLQLIQIRSDCSDGAQILESCLELFESAISNGMLSPELYEQFITMLSNMGLSEDASLVAERAVESFPSSGSLWHLRLSNLLETGVSLDEIVKVFQAAKRKVSEKASWSLWELILHVMAEKHHPGLEALMEEAVRTLAPEVCQPAKEWCLEWTYRTGGIKKARQVYKTLKCMRPITLEFYRQYIVIEVSQLEPNVSNIRAAFEEALTEFGQQHQDLWLNYMEMERKIGQDASKAGVIHERALNALNKDLKESFIRKNAMIGLAA